MAEHPLADIPSPYGFPKVPLTPEQKTRVVAWMEQEGFLDPECPGCKEFYAAPDPRNVFAPGHRVKSSCESGKRPHCTCDRCF